MIQLTITENQYTIILKGLKLMMEMCIGGDYTKELIKTMEDQVEIVD